VSSAVESLSSSASFPVDRLSLQETLTEKKEIRDGLGFLLIRRKLMIQRKRGMTLFVVFEGKKRLRINRE